MCVCVFAAHGLAFKVFFVNVCSLLTRASHAARGMSHSCMPLLMLATQSHARTHTDTHIYMHFYALNGSSSPLQFHFDFLLFLLKFLCFYCHCMLENATKATTTTHLLCIVVSIFGVFGFVLHSFVINLRIMHNICTLFLLPVPLTHC